MKNELYVWEKKFVDFNKLYHEFEWMEQLCFTMYSLASRWLLRSVGFLPQHIDRNKQNHERTKTAQTSRNNTKSTDAQTVKK